LRRRFCADLHQGAAGRQQVSPLFLWVQGDVLALDHVLQVRQ